MNGYGLLDYLWASTHLNSKFSHLSPHLAYSKSKWNVLVVPLRVALWYISKSSLWGAVGSSNIFSLGSWLGERRGKFEFKWLGAQRKSSYGLGQPRVGRWDGPLVRYTQGVRGVVGNGPNKSALVPIEGGFRKETHQTNIQYGLGLFLGNRIVCSRSLSSNHRKATSRGVYAPFWLVFILHFWSNSTTGAPGIRKIELETNMRGWGERM